MTHLEQQIEEAKQKIQALEASAELEEGAKKESLQYWNAVLEGSLFILQKRRAKPAA